MPVFQQWKPRRVDGLQFRSRSRRMEYINTHTLKQQQQKRVEALLFGLVFHVTRSYGHCRRNKTSRYGITQSSVWKSPTLLMVNKNC